MELNINAPACFKEHYGMDDEVYKFCRKAYNFLRTENTAIFYILENYYKADSSGKVADLLSLKE